jgi:hypothetical protein
MYIFWFLIKHDRHCTAAHSLSHLGPEGYHWRVMVEDNNKHHTATSTSSTTISTTTYSTTNATLGSERSFSWWDIQDGNAKLPLKETTPTDLQNLLFPSNKSTTTTTNTLSSTISTDTAAKAAKGAFKLMGKAMASAMGEDVTGTDKSTSASATSNSNSNTTTTTTTTTTGLSVAVLVVKLLDLVKLHDEYSLKNAGTCSTPKQIIPRPPRKTHTPASARPPQQQQQHQSRQKQTPPQQTRPTASTSGGSAPHQQQQQQRPYGSSNGVMASASPSASGDLMDFGDAPVSIASSRGAVVPGGGSSNNASNFNPKILRHAHSSPALRVDPNETRAQRLKREQEQRMKTINRVWDDIDQRWVQVGPSDQITTTATTTTTTSTISQSTTNLGAVFGSTTSNFNNSMSMLPPEKKQIGIKLDLSNAAGKSASVQKAITDRVNEMEANRQRAVAEVKQREAIKKQREEEEDKIRQQLEPKIKIWAEEHGKKKQLTALLGTLHTILWPGAKWKQVSIGDVLDPKKCKKIYFKATLVVHPDKTHDLPADQRFLAKRIFDALTQAKTIYDQNGGR